MILVVSSKRDGHVERVAEALKQNGREWVRINTEDIARNLSVSVDPPSGTGEIRVFDSNRSFRLEDVTAVWYRKPDPFDLSHFEMDEHAIDYAEAELRETLEGIYALTGDALWINNPLTSRIAHRKMLQLKVAASLGFNVPKTVITNSVEEALRFAESLDWDIAVKSLGAISVTQSGTAAPRQFGLFTRRINREELLSVQDKIPHLPTCFQEYIDKAYELRITCAGSEIFSCRIDSQDHELNREDMRFDIKSARHRIVSVPKLESRLAKYLKAFDLNFGCFDIAVSKSGHFYFLECNPNGQWAWIEEMTGAPIAAAVARLIMNTACTSKSDATK